MHKSFRIFFSSVAVIRLLGIIAFFVIEAWRKSDSRLEGLNLFDIDVDIDLHFEWWEWLSMYMIVAAYPLNTILSLILSFKPKWFFTSFLRYKIIPVVLYVSELVVIPFFAYLAVERVQDAFYPPEPETYLGQLFNTLLPGDAVSIYEKCDTINLCILILCGILFLASFWSFYKARKKMYDAPII
jgi:hypothetical protein